MTGNFLSNIMNAISKKIAKIFNNPYSKIGVSWLTMKKLKHQDYNNPGSIEIYGNKFSYLHPPEVVYSLKEFYVNDIYKINFNTQNPYIIDCGANIGFSILKFKLQYPNAKILAFEPDEKNFELLKNNTKQFSNIQLENKAVWNENTTLQFNMIGTQGSSSFGDGRENYKSVSAVKLKSYLQQPVDFLKIDIEGAEYEVLMDCKEELKNVSKLFVEYHGIFEEQYKFYDIIDVLKKLQYKVYIKEADDVYPSPFAITKRKSYDQQYNIFAFH
ncbi:MAG: FkbM family methyltransferase [Chitinophagaceae bacterium]